MPCESVGFAAIGFPVRIEFRMQGNDGVALTCHAAPHRIHAVSRWLESQGDVLLSVAPGLAPLQVHAEFPMVPASWSPLLQALVPMTVEVSAGGTVSIFTNAPAAALGRYCASLPMHGFRVRPVARAPDPHTLSPRQREALDTAVAMGYYDIPHAVTLRHVAARMGLSPGTASELLRRAEAAIMQGYADASALARTQVVHPIRSS